LIIAAAAAPLLAELPACRPRHRAGAPLAQRMEDGRAKLLLTWEGPCSCGAARNPQLFRDGRLPGGCACGECGPQHVCAFARAACGSSPSWSFAPRLVTGACSATKVGCPLGQAVWGETLIELPREERAPRRASFP